MKTDTVAIIGIPSALDIAAAAQGIVTRAALSQTGFQTLDFVSNERPHDRLEETDITAMKKGGYTLDTKKAGSHCWPVEIRDLWLDDNLGNMIVHGKVSLGTCIDIGVRVECDLKNRIGIMTGLTLKLGSLESIG